MAVNLSNRITELLSIRYPIIEGGMAHVGDGRLAAAVTKAGGLGQISVSGFSPKQFRQQIEIAMSETSGPIGVNVPLGNSFEFERYFTVIEEMKDNLTAISLSSGDPRPHLPRLKEMGLIVMVVVASVKHAINAEKGGADIVICEGFEAGGRNSPQELTLFSLIPSITENVSIPLVAAGGISNGKSMFGAMALGAEGVQVGTRLIATEESSAHLSYKDALVQAGEGSTTIIERNIGGRNRVLFSDFVQRIQEFEKSNPSFTEFFNYINGQRNRVAALGGNMEEGWVHAGQGISFINKIDTVDNVIQEYMSDVKKAYEDLCRKMETLSRI